MKSLINGITRHRQKRRRIKFLSLTHLIKRNTCIKDQQLGLLVYLTLDKKNLKKFNNQKEK